MPNNKLIRNQDDHRRMYAKINTMTIEKELKQAQSILDNNPVLQLSPGDLRREGRTVEEYLSRWSEAEQEKYRDYYEDEL